MRHYALYAALLLSSCRASRIDPEEQPWPIASVPPVTVAADGGAPGGKVPDSLASKPVTSQVVPAESEALRVAKLPNKVQRRYRKNVKALAKAQPRTVPKKMAKGASLQQATGDNIQQQSGYKPAAPQAQAADSASIQQATAEKDAQAAAGEGIKQEKPAPPPGKPWQAYVFGPVGIALAVLLVAGVAYGVWQYRRARTIV